MPTLGELIRSLQRDDVLAALAKLYTAQAKTRTDMRMCGPSCK
jgi:hypothetical protein